MPPRCQRLPAGSTPRSNEPPAHYHFAGLLLRGLSGPGQDVWWFTDQDEIVANEQRLRSFVSLTGLHQQPLPPGAPAPPTDRNPSMTHSTLHAAGKSENDKTF